MINMAAMMKMARDMKKVMEKTSYQVSHQIDTLTFKLGHVESML
jgi:DNA-binding protein YbaB